MGFWQKVMGWAVLSFLVSAAYLLELLMIGESPITPLVLIKVWVGGAALSMLPYFSLSVKSVRVFLAWYDMWIGFFYDQKKRVLYCCPLPCCVIKFEFNNISEE